MERPFLDSILSQSFTHGHPDSAQPPQLLQMDSSNSLFSPACDLLTVMGAESSATSEQSNFTRHLAQRSSPRSFPVQSSLRGGRPAHNPPWDRVVRSVQASSLTPTQAGVPTFSAANVSLRLLPCRRLPWSIYFLLRFTLKAYSPGYLPP